MNGDENRSAKLEWGSVDEVYHQSVLFEINQILVAIFIRNSVYVWTLIKFTLLRHR